MKELGWSEQSLDKYATLSGNQTVFKLSSFDIFEMRLQQQSDVNLVHCGSASSSLIDRLQSRNCHRDFHFTRRYHSMIFICPSAISRPFVSYWHFHPMFPPVSINTLARLRFRCASQGFTFHIFHCHLILTLLYYFPDAI